MYHNLHACSQFHVISFDNVLLLISRTSRILVKLPELGWCLGGYSLINQVLACLKINTQVNRKIYRKFYDTLLDELSVIVETKVKLVHWNPVYLYIELVYLIRALCTVKKPKIHTLNKFSNFLNHIIQFSDNEWSICSNRVVCLMFWTPFLIGFSLSFCWILQSITHSSPWHTFMSIVMCKIMGPTHNQPDSHESLFLYGEQSTK